MAAGDTKFPIWLRRRLPEGSHLNKTAELLADLALNTVCEEARCPNRAECYAKGTATFLALGSQCTRSCSFCSIDFSKNPAVPDHEEPAKIAESIYRMQLRHAVITMVARDDLADDGGKHMVAIIRAIRERCPEATVELLTSDFGGNLDALDMVLAEQPEVYNHNVETVERLTPRVRHRATYRRSVALLRQARKPLKGYLKSGFMVGLGETSDEVQYTLDDLAQAGVDIVTVGQYLQSHPKKRPVSRFVTPEEFEQIAAWGQERGIAHMYCAPFVRSSYNAELFVEGSVHVG